MVMKLLAALASGMAGAVTVTVVHEIVKRIDPKAPRMDLLGMNALSKMMVKAGETPPNRRELFLYTMAGDLIANGLYYSLAGVGYKKPWLKGTLLGTAAGIGGVLLPKPLGLNPAYSARTTPTKLMTIGLYLIGGLVTSAIVKSLQNKGL
jgi:hypothetical protein